MAINKRFASEEYVNENYAPISHPHSWADSGDKITYGDTLTWDGNTEGLEFGTFTVNISENYSLFRLSEATPTYDELTTHGFSLSFDNGDVDDSGEFIEIVSDNIVNINDGAIYIAYEDNITATVYESTLYLPKKGIYFYEHNPDGFGDNVVALTINGYKGFPTTEIVPLPEKYAPVPDMIIEVTGDASYNEYTKESLSVAYGNIDVMREKIKKGQKVNVYLVGKILAGSGVTAEVVLQASTTHIMSNDLAYITFLSTSADGREFYVINIEMLHDGTVTNVFTSMHKQN